MIYLGGKNRLGRRIAAVLESHRVGGQPYVEPFVGGAGVLQWMGGLRLAGDIDGDVVAMWERAVDGWVPPSSVSAAEYESARRAEPHLRGFIKYACSWGGKPWGGYARGNRDYARVGSEGVVGKAARLRGTRFYTCSFEAWQPVGSLVYCDPPYAGTTGYGVPFDRAAFWDVVRRWSMHNTVIVSEYAAPDDFCEIAAWPLRNKLDGRAVMEKLFRVKVPAMSPR